LLPSDPTHRHCNRPGACAGPYVVFHLILGAKLPDYP
jgi:hypothetical protein